MKRLVRLSILGCALLALGAGCILPLSTAGNTASIQFVSTTTTGGWKYDYYRNSAYPCAISGSQTFVIGTKVGSSATVALVEASDPAAPPVCAPEAETAFNSPPRPVDFSADVAASVRR